MPIWFLCYIAMGNRIVAFCFHRQRIAELDTLIERLYVDNVSGKIMIYIETNDAVSTSNK